MSILSPKPWPAPARTSFRVQVFVGGLRSDCIEHAETAWEAAMQATGGPLVLSGPPARLRAKACPLVADKVVSITRFYEPVTPTFPPPVTTD